MKNEQLLKDIGLNDIASKIYLFLLEEKKSTILDIARGTKIARTSIYSNIELLKQWGLVGQAIDGKKKYVYPESPSNLVNVIQIREKLAEQAVKKLLPSFENDRSEFNVKFYEGAEGLKKIGDLMLKSKEKKLFHIARKNIMEEFLSKQYLKKFREQRASLKIETRILIDSTEITHLEHPDYNNKSNDSLNRSIKILPKNIMVGMYFIIFDDKVAFFGSKNEKYAILIENKSLANSMKTIYNFLWLSSKSI